MKRVIVLAILMLAILGCNVPVYEPKIEPKQIDTTAFERQLTETEQETSNAMYTPTNNGNSTTKRFSIRAYQFAYEPKTLSVDYGDTVIITVTSVDVGHGFALPDFGVNKRVPPEESVTFQFVADRRGNFTFFNPVYSGSGWKDMKGNFMVR
jgi:cytochrome c oxidase subunit 2